MGIIELLTSVLGGGMTGLLGGVANRYFDWLAEKEKVKLQEMTFKHEYAIAEKEAEKAVILAKEQREQKETEASYAALTESYKTDKATFFSESWMAVMGARTKAIVGFMFAMVDLVRGLTRPGLTLYLCIVSTWMTYKIYVIFDALTPKITADTASLGQLVGTANTIIIAILYLTTTAVSWWFASRGTGIRSQK
jgi:hypothetical protein